MSMSNKVLAAARPVMMKQQRRTFINWMTNYPDKVMELKKIHQANARTVFTWQKMPQDKIANGIGIGLVVFGIAQLIPAYYHLATGKGKMD